jgi:antitoxin component of RelBE/YafQ-DinJ toxin-antitoxin module
MGKKNETYQNPEFKDLDEEHRYWQEHSPLDEGYEGRVQKASQKRNSFLTIRLTEEELTQLRDLSTSLGMKPSTLMRIGLKLMINNVDQPYFYEWLGHTKSRNRSVCDFATHKDDEYMNVIKTKILEYKNRNMRSDSDVEDIYLVLRPNEVQDLILRTLTETQSNLYRNILCNLSSRAIARKDDDYKKISKIVEARISSGKD